MAGRSARKSVVHTATFEIARDRELTGPGRVRVQMIQHYSSGEHRLGRFRIAVTRAPGALQEGLPGDLSDIVHRERAERTAEQQALLEDHYLQFQPGFAEATAAWQAAKPICRRSARRTIGTTDRGTEVSRCQPIQSSCVYSEPFP